MPRLGPEYGAPGGGHIPAYVFLLGLTSNLVIGDPVPCPTKDFHPAARVCDLADHLSSLDPTMTLTWP